MTGPNPVGWLSVDIGAEEVGLGKEMNEKSRQPVGVIHKAKAVDTDSIQRCAICNLPLKDFRIKGFNFPSDQDLEFVAWPGGSVYPEGALVEMTPHFQAVSLTAKEPTCKPV